MKKSSKKISGLTKRIIALAVCFTALAQGTVFADSSSHRAAGGGKKIIEESTAIDYACKDLGINTEEAEIKSAEVVLEDGQYVYKIDLVYDETEYIYNIRVLDGIVAKVTCPTSEEEAETPAEEETVTEENTDSSVNLDALAAEADKASEKPSNRAAGRGKIISKREAIDYACGDIGVEAEDADVKSVETVLEDGQYSYKVCFIYDGTEYTYNIRVYNGAVIKRTFGPADK
ncbi:MAG: PepSY domain-containing protein [Clostridiales bacterium]|nr:PepSY domain-containing protein [Clostridiales bacterium]